MRRAIVVVSLLATSACGASGAEPTRAEPDPKPSSGAERVMVEPPARVERARVDTEGVTVEPPARVDAARISVDRQEPYGTYLVDDLGYPLYLFTADTPGVRSACHDDCARAWPPVLSAGEPEAADSAVQASMLGSIARSGTEHHATYNGWPLYIYAADLPGQVRGHGVESFGGEWMLISPEGAPIGPIEVQARR